MIRISPIGRCRIKMNGIEKSVHCTRLIYCTLLFISDFMQEMPEIFSKLVVIDRPYLVHSKCPSPDPLFLSITSRTHRRLPESP